MQTPSRVQVLDNGLENVDSKYSIKTVKKVSVRPTTENSPVSDRDRYEEKGIVNLNI